MKKFTFLIMMLCCVVAKAATEDLSIDNFNCWSNGDDPVTYQCSKEGSTITFNQTWGGGSWWFGGKDCTKYQSVVFEFVALEHTVYFEVSSSDGTTDGDGNIKETVWKTATAAVGATSIIVTLDESTKNNIRQVTIKATDDVDGTSSTSSITLTGVYFSEGPEFNWATIDIYDEDHESYGISKSAIQDLDEEVKVSFTLNYPESYNTWGTAAEIWDYSSNKKGVLTYTVGATTSTNTFTVETLLEYMGEDNGLSISLWHASGGVTLESEATLSLNQVDITVGSAGYATMILPFAASIPDGMTVYTASIGTDAVTLNEAETIAANTPYIVKGTANTTYTFYGIADADDYSYGNKLVGTYEESKTVDAGDYVLYDGDNGIGFYKAGSSVTIEQCHAYLPASAVTGEAKALRFVFPDDANAITAMESDADATVVGRYTLDGTQIQAPQQGINILKMSDGTVRKVLVK